MDGRCSVAKEQQKAAAADGGGDGRWGPQPWVVGTPSPWENHFSSSSPSAPANPYVQVSPIPGSAGSSNPSPNSYYPSAPSSSSPAPGNGGPVNPYVQVSPIPGSAGSSNPSPNSYYPSAPSSSPAPGNGGPGNPYVQVSPIPGSAGSSNPSPNSYYPSVPSSSSAAPGNGGPGNPYVQVAPHPAEKSSTDVLIKALGRCGKKLESSTRKAGGVAGNVWNHLKTSPNLTDAALTKLAQGTKVLAEGGNDKVFQQIFGIYPGEQLLKSFACYLSTSSGPVIGTLYLSTRRIAFCSDNPLSQNVAQGQQERTYYKVVLLLDQLKAINPSNNKANAAEKYIQVVTVDGHEFWFMGFVSYDKAIKNLMEAMQSSRFTAQQFAPSW